MNIQIGNEEQDDYEHIRLYGEHLRREKQRKIDMERIIAQNKQDEDIKRYIMSMIIVGFIVLLLKAC